MLRQLFSTQNKVDVWMDTKINVPKKNFDIYSASLRGLTDGLIMGFVIGGVFGITQGWVNDAKAKELCVLSSSWALNGAAIGAVALALGNAFLEGDLTPSNYTPR